MSHAGKLNYGEDYTPTQYLPKALRDRNTYQALDNSKTLC